MKILKISRKNEVTSISCNDKLAKVKDNAADDIADGLAALIHINDTKRSLSYCSETDLGWIENLVKEAVANGPKVLQMIKEQRKKGGRK